MFSIYAKKFGEKFEVKVSPESFVLVKNINWYLDKDGYAVSSKSIKMHRLVLGAKKGEEIDHINREKLDNRIENLRIVSHHENTLNRVRGLGIIYDEDRKKWRARLKFKGKEVHLGRFETREEALNARKEGAIKYFGEYAFI